MLASLSPRFSALVGERATAIWSNGVLKTSTNLCCGLKSRHVFSTTYLKQQIATLSIIAKRTEAARTSSRQRISRLLHNRTSQARRERRVSPHRRHLASIRDHATRFGRGILQLRRTFAAGEGVIVVRQIHNRDLARVVASEERGLLVQAFAEERGRGWYDGHLGQARELRLRVRLVEFATVREIAAGVRGVVIYQNDADAAGGLEEGEEGVVLVGFAAVDEGKFGLGLHEGGVGVLIKGVGVGRVFIHKCQGVGLCYDGGNVGEDAGNVGDKGECGAEFVEDVGGGAKDVSWER